MMTNNRYQHFWQEFISGFIHVREDKSVMKDRVKDYHLIVQYSFSKLGWVSGRDILSRNLLGGKIDSPDFFLKGIPIKVKLPSDAMNKDDIEQLNKYMRQSNSNTGIYIGEHIRVFYRPSIEDELKIVVDADLEENDIEGLAFAELFMYPCFDAKSLRSDLETLYKLERVLDDLYVTKFVSKKWIKDRYCKRALYKHQ